MKHRKPEPRILEPGEPLPELGPVAQYMAHIQWLAGRDTEEIRLDLGVDEAAVYNSLSRLRDKRAVNRRKVSRRSLLTSGP